MSEFRPPITVLFKDVDVRFIAHPVNGELLVKKNADAIKQSVKNLVLTNRFEKLFRPDIYGGVTELLFENFDNATLILLRQRIEDVVNYHEPRARVVKVLVDDLPDNNQLTVSIIFECKNIQEPLRIDLFFERIR